MLNGAGQAISLELVVDGGGAGPTHIAAHQVGAAVAVVVEQCGQGGVGEVP